MGIEIPSAIMAGQKAPPDMKIPEKVIPLPGNTQEKKAVGADMSKADIELAMKSLAQAASIFNKRLSYSINDELGMVVVKVIDTETDKVIKELPAKELQRLMARLKEAIGLLVDETI